MKYPVIFDEVSFPYDKCRQAGVYCLGGPDASCVQDHSCTFIAVFDYSLSQSGMETAIVTIAGLRSRTNFMATGFCKYQSDTSAGLNDCIVIQNSNFDKYKGVKDRGFGWQYAFYVESNGDITGSGRIFDSKRQLGLSTFVVQFDIILGQIDINGKDYHLLHTPYYLSIASTQLAHIEDHTYYPVDWFKKTPTAVTLNDEVFSYDKCNLSSGAYCIGGPIQYCEQAHACSALAIYEVTQNGKNIHLTLAGTRSTTEYTATALSKNPNSWAESIVIRSSIVGLELSPQLELYAFYTGNSEDFTKNPQNISAMITNREIRTTTFLVEIDLGDKISYDGGSYQLTDTYYYLSVLTINTNKKDWAIQFEVPVKLHGKGIKTSAAIGTVFVSTVITLIITLIR